MHREVIWSPLAEKDLGNILEYLFENWNQSNNSLSQQN